MRSCIRFHPSELGISTALTLFFLSAPCGLAVEPAKDESAEQQNVELALQLTRDAAKKYEFAAAADKPLLTLREKPVLQWSNPERGQIYGNVFLWTDHGRPAVIGSLFKWFSPYTHTSHEFHSLLDGSITAKFHQADVWTTNEPGVTFGSLPDAPMVAETTVARASQMRQLARQFTVRRTERDGQKNEMRLLPQPVYRYEVNGESLPGLIDGGLFVFVQGTDPELWLLLEAHEESIQANARQPDNRTWRYGVARMNSTAFSVEHNGRQVAQIEIMSFSEVHAHKRAYTSFQFDR